MLKIFCTVFAICLFTMPCFAEDGSTPEDINKQIFTMARSKIKSVNTATLKSWIEKEKDFLLLDIREPDEINAARIKTKNHLEIPRGVVEFLFLPRVKNTNATVVVYCLMGNRSAAVADILTRYGYKNVYNLDQGILGWIKADYPVENFFGSFQIKNFNSNF